VTSSETRYARSGSLRIAYQAIGNGPVDLIFVPGFISNLDLNWEDPGYSRLLRRLSSFARVIQFDKRGTGLSDRVNDSGLPSAGDRIDDIRAVMDAAGSGRAVLLGVSEGAALSILFSATFPSRTRALALYGGYAQFHASVMRDAAFEDFIQTIDRSWGRGASLPYLLPGRARDARFQSWWARFERLSASPSAAIALMHMNAQIDVRAYLGTLRVPALVLHRRDDVWVKLAGARDLAHRIKGARLVELAGRDHPIWSGEVDHLADEIEEFVTGVRPAPSQHRVLTTILAARLVSPERLLRRLDDGQWHERVEQFRSARENIVARFGGEMVVSGVEELRARFDSPGRAVGCAIALRDAADGLDLKLATGVHTGEVEIHGDVISGYALHVTQKISNLAGVGEVLVSSVVNDLVSGSGFHFVERPVVSTGMDDRGLRLFSVMIEQHLEPIARAVKTPTLDLLSHREREVLTLVADGLSNAAIAHQLALSEHTVKRHVANILVKFDLPTRAAAAAVVARERTG
jgi:pimeloyl-ACP methyl ester carboxylesterase/DNA-binding CsgD family transcriptional regulator